MPSLLAQPDLELAQVTSCVRALGLQGRHVARAIRQKRAVVDAHVAPAEGVRLEKLAAAGVDDLRAQLVHRRRAVGAACTRWGHVISVWDLARDFGFSTE